MKISSFVFIFSLLPLAMASHARATDTARAGQHDFSRPQQASAEYDFSLNPKIKGAVAKSAAEVIPRHQHDFSKTHAADPSYQFEDNTFIPAPAAVISTSEIKFLQRQHDKSMSGL